MPSLVFQVVQTGPDTAPHPPPPFFQALARQSVDVDKRLGAQSARLWSEIVARRYDYDRPWRSAERIRRATRQQIVEFFDRVLAPGAPDGRRLVTHVFSRRDAPPSLAPDAKAALADAPFYPPPPDRFPGGGVGVGSTAVVEL